MQGWPSHICTVVPSKWIGTPYPQTYLSVGDNLPPLHLQWTYSQQEEWIGCRTARARDPWFR